MAELCNDGDKENEVMMERDEKRVEMEAFRQDSGPESDKVNAARGTSAR